MDSTSSMEGYQSSEEYGNYLSKDVHTRFLGHEVRNDRNFYN